MSDIVVNIEDSDIDEVIRMFGEDLEDEIALNNFEDDDNDEIALNNIEDDDLEFYYIFEDEEFEYVDNNDSVDEL